MACRISTPSHDNSPRGQTYCEVSPAKPYNHIKDHQSRNEHVCSALNCCLYGASTFAAVWPFSSTTFTSVSVENAAQNKTVTLVLQTTKLDTVMVECRFFRRVSVLRAKIQMTVFVSGGSMETAVACLNSMSAQRSCTWFDDLEFIRCTTLTSLKLIKGNMNTNRCISDILLPVSMQ